MQNDLGCWSASTREGLISLRLGASADPRLRDRPTTRQLDVKNRSVRLGWLDFDGTSVCENNLSSNGEAEPSAVRPSRFKEAKHFYGLRNPGARIFHVDTHLFRIG